MARYAQVGQNCGVWGFEYAGFSNESDEMPAISDELHVRITCISPRLVQISPFFNKVFDELQGNSMEMNKLHY